MSLRSFNTLVFATLKAKVAQVLASPIEFALHRAKSKPNPHMCLNLGIFEGLLNDTVEAGDPAF